MTTQKSQTIKQFHSTVMQHEQGANISAMNQHKKWTETSIETKKWFGISKTYYFEKQKVTKENGLPPTIEIANHTNVICKQKTKTSTEMNGNYIVATLDFSLNEIVWGKIRGWPHWRPHWPARITSIEGRRFEVQWFNGSMTIESQNYSAPNYLNFLRITMNFPNYLTKKLD